MRNKESSVHSSQSLTCQYSSEAGHRLHKSKYSDVVIDKKPPTSPTASQPHVTGTVTSKTDRSYSEKATVDNSSEVKPIPCSSSSLLKVTLKNPSIQRRNSEPVVLIKKQKAKDSVPVNFASDRDQEFYDWLEKKKKKLSLPILEFDDLNSTLEMEAAFSDILNEVDKQDFLSDASAVGSPIEEGYGSPIDAGQRSPIEEGFEDLSLGDGCKVENRNNFCNIEVC